MHLLPNFKDSRSQHMNEDQGFCNYSPTNSILEQHWRIKNVFFFISRFSRKLLTKHKEQKGCDLRAGNYGLHPRRAGAGGREGRRQLHTCLGYFRGSRRQPPRVELRLPHLNSCSLPFSSPHLARRRDRHCGERHNYDYSIVYSEI